MGQKNVQFRKNFIWNVLGTGLNAFNSLFFMIIVTRINGIYILLVCMQGEYIK